MIEGYEAFISNIHLFIGSFNWQFIGKYLYFTVHHYLCMVSASLFDLQPAYCLHAVQFHSILSHRSSVYAVNSFFLSLACCISKQLEFHFISFYFISFYLSQIKMKIFQSIQHSFTILGITVNQSQEQWPLNFKHLFVFIALNASITAQIVCIISLAENFEEYTVCMYGIFTLAMFEMEYGIHIWKMKQLFKFIENFEHLIESSELNLDY